MDKQNRKTQRETGNSGALSYLLSRIIKYKLYIAFILLAVFTFNLVMFYITDYLYEYYVIVEPVMITSPGSNAKVRLFSPSEMVNQVSKELIENYIAGKNEEILHTREFRKLNASVFNSSKYVRLSTRGNENSPAPELFGYIIELLEEYYSNELSYLKKKFQANIDNTSRGIAIMEKKVEDKIIIIDNHAKSHKLNMENIIRRINLNKKQIEQHEIYIKEGAAMIRSVKENTDELIKKRAQLSGVSGVDAAVSGLLLVNVSQSNIALLNNLNHQMISGQTALKNLEVEIAEKESSREEEIRAYESKYRNQQIELQSLKDSLDKSNDDLRIHNDEMKLTSALKTVAGPMRSIRPINSFQETVKNAAVNSLLAIFAFLLLAILVENAGNLISQAQVAFGLNPSD